MPNLIDMAGRLAELLKGAKGRYRWSQGRCPIDSLPLQPIPGDPRRACARGHRFGPGQEEGDLFNQGDYSRFRDEL